MTHRVVFLGSPEFAVPALESLVADDRLEVVLVVSQPDRRAGRGRKLTPPPVASFASSAGIDLFQPESLKDDVAINRVAAAGPDLLVVVAYGEILNRRVLTLSDRGAINVHPSLLPRYRGAAPIPAAILNGDDETGVSIMQLVRKLDAGPVIAQKACPVQPDDTTGSLSTRLATMAAVILPDVAAGWVSGKAQAIPQDHDLATYTREWTKADARIDWTRPAVEIERLVRAAQPWPVAWTELDGHRVQIRESALTGDLRFDGAPPGTIISHAGRALVATGSDAIELVTVQPESKRPIAGNEWLRNRRSEQSIFT